MKMKRLLWGFMMVAALALLAGCGGGGGTSLMIDGMRATQEAITNATTARDTYKAQVTELQDKIDDLNEQIAAAPTQARIDELTKERDKYKMDLDTALAQLKQIQDDAADALAAAAKKERIAREEALREALTSSATGGNNRVPATTTMQPVTSNNSNSGITDISITRDVAGMVKIDVNGATDDVYSGGSVTAGSGSWTSATLTKTDAATEAQDTAMIYTDIDAPSDLSFSTKYPTQSVLDDILDPEQDNTLTTNEQRADRLKLISSSGFPSAPGTTWTYTGNQGQRPKSVDGTFHGVLGVFTCTTDTCNVSTDSNGMIQASGDNDGTWRFTPNAPNTATVKEPDAGYAWFGWWLNKPKSNTADHDIEVFAGGSTNYAASFQDTLRGNAIYSGPAAGRYLTKTFSAGAQTDAGAGDFTANANLTAKFSAATPNISGSISGFVLDGTDTTTASSWKVTLETATLTDDSPLFNGTTEVDFGAGATSTNVGQWQGSFFNASPDSVAEASRYPNTVVGVFDANTTNASVIGGFGAER